MTNVRKLEVVQARPDTAEVPEIIAMLEKVLVHAKEGKVKALAIAHTLEDGQPSPLICSAWHNEAHNFYNLVAAVERLRGRIHQIFEAEDAQVNLEDPKSPA